MVTVHYSVVSALAGPAPIFSIHALLDTKQASGVIGLHEQGDRRWARDAFDTYFTPPLRHPFDAADVQRLLALIEQYHRQPLAEYVPNLVVDGSFSTFLVRGEVDLSMHWGSDAPDEWIDQVAPLEEFLQGLFTKYSPTTGD